MKSLARLLSTALLTLTLSIIQFAAHAAVIDGKPTFDAAKNAGFYVWRSSDGYYHMRATSGSKLQSVSGGLTTTKPFDWISKTNLEGTDTFQRVTPQQIKFGFNIDQKDLLDGLDFGVPNGGGLCLWIWGSLGNTARLGAAATAVTPLGYARVIDLLDNGGCVGIVKSNPGHYIALNDWDTQAAMVDAALQPGVKGIHKRYFWKDLEPTAGNYDFSKIQSDLDLAAKNGFQLIAMIVDKSFTNSMNPVPGYLAGYTWPVANGGYVAGRWQPYVIQRLALLSQALGAAFDRHPNFEGIAFQESALGISWSTMSASGYTPEAYRDGLIQILKNARAAAPRSQVFWYMNFLDGRTAYIGDIATAIVPFKVAMGGPDVLPDNWSLQKLTYPYYTQFAGQLVLFGSMQYDSYDHLHANTAYPTKYWTMPELYGFAKNLLHVNYVFWTRKTAASPSDSYTWFNALPVIKYNPGPFNPLPAGW
jgi:hypothetical protein